MINFIKFTPAKTNFRLTFFLYSFIVFILMYRVIVKVLDSAREVCSLPLCHRDVSVDLHEAGLLQLHLVGRVKGSKDPELIMRLILPVPSFGLGIWITYKDMYFVLY